VSKTPQAERDRRLTPARPDLAAESLRGEIDAERYTTGTEHRVSVPVLPIFRTATQTGMRETELLFGETFTVYEERNGWAWGQANLDGYVGYVRADGLSPCDDLRPSHRVSTLRTIVFSQPDIKSPPVHFLSFGSRLCISETTGRFLSLAGGGYVIADHCLPIDHSWSDPVDLAEYFLYTPYLWGGRSSIGLDCSGLVQLCLAGAGLACPRDADQQEQAFCQDSAPVTNGQDKARPVRGDLIFWRGHVAIMRNDTEIIHANGTSMRVSIDALDGFSKRVLDETGPVRNIAGMADRLDTI